MDYLAVVNCKSSRIAAISGSVKRTADTLVLSPGQATFTRPLGDFTSLE